MNKFFTLLILAVCSVPNLAQALTITVTTTGTAATLTYVSNATGWAITRCNTEASGVLNIPSSISGFNVTEIRTEAFRFCTSLTSVTIPSSVTTIGSGAFESCTSLASVTIPSSVTTIEISAFQSCTSLASVTIPNSVTTIGNFAFQDCTALTNFVIPDRFLVALGRIGIPDALGSQILLEATAAYVAENNPASNEELIDALAADDAFLLALAQRVAAQNSAIYATKTELAGYATKAQITDATLGGLATGINTVTSHPNSWSLFTTAQIQEMAVGDLMLTRQENGVFVLNYDIEQSDDLNNWTTYKTNAEQLTGLPTDKAFVRIKLKE
jgi:hypothetical protein